MTKAATKTPDAAAIAKHLAAEEAAEKAKSILIMPELRDFLDILTPEERKELREELIADGGARDPIVIWKETGVIADGHNRYAICMAENLKFTTVEKSFENIDAVKDWMIRNQLGRRNLTPIRSTYFMGLLYNKTKQDPTQARTDAGGENTAGKLAKTFAVGEKTVRRAGDLATGVDIVAKAKGLTEVREKLALLKGKSEGGFNKEELEDLGKLAKKDEKAAVALVPKIEEIKKAEQAQKEAVKAVKQKVNAAKPAVKTTPAEKAKKYPVALVRPNFGGMNYNVATEKKPSMADNAVVYIVAADEELPAAFELMKKWQLSYDGMLIFETKDSYESMFADVNHTCLLCATRGVVAIGGKAIKSIVPKNGISAEEAMVKTIEAYHQKEAKLDMRSNTTAKGWDAPKA